MRRLVSILRWDIAAVLLMLLLWGGYRAMTNPWIQPAEERTVEGSRPPDHTEGDVLLLLPNRPAARAESLDQLDCTYGWFNSLWQHFGSFATALTRDLTPGLLAGRHTVIVPRRVTDDMPSTGIDALESFVRDGGQLVLEHPNINWQSLTKLTVGSETTTAGSISSLEGMGIHGPTRRHLPDVPLAGRLMAGPSLDPWPQGGSLLEIDGQTGAALRRVGDGLVYSLLFDFGCSVTGLQQGHPDEQMTFTEAGDSGNNHDLLPAIERAAADRMQTAEIPYADLLERALFRRLSNHRPAPRLWPYPARRRGAVIVVYPSPETARGAKVFSEYADHQGARGVPLLAGDKASEEIVETFESRGATPGLLWVRGLTRPPTTTTWGIGPFEPYGWERSLVSQRRQLGAYLPNDEQPQLVRTEDARLAPGWAETFSQMAAGSLRIDVSMGPTSADNWGYAFGTGFPFYPIDTRGLPLPLMEMPFVLHGPNLTPERLDTLLTRSDEYYHQSLTVSLPSNVMRDDPSADIMLTYRDLFEEARSHRHWLTTPSEFAQFLSSRRRSILTSQWYPDDRNLTISVNLVGTRIQTPGGPSASDQTQTEATTPGVAIPRRFEGQQIDSLSVDGDARDPGRASVSGPGDELIISVPTGRHTIDVTYEPPATDSSTGDNSTTDE